MRFGDKMFTHLAAAQLFASHGAASVIPACCGVVGSAVAEWIAGGPRGWTPPRWVCDVVEGTFGRVLRGGGGIAPRATVRRANARPGGGGGGAVGIGVEPNEFVEPHAGAAAAAGCGGDARVDGIRRARGEARAGDVRERPGGCHEHPAGRGRLTTRAVIAY